MKRWGILVVIACLSLFLSSLPGIAGPAATLPELINPDELHVDDGQIYVVEGVKIFIYSLEDFKLVTSFGRRGEGPREFMQRANNPVSIILEDQQIVIRSYGKLSYFKKDGSFIMEKKINPRSGREHQPFNQGYVARFVTRHNDGNLSHGIAFYDKDFNKTKEIYNHPHGFPLYRKFEFNPLTIHQPFFKIFDNHIFVIDGARSNVTIYDDQGRATATLENKTELKPFTEEDKRDMIAGYKRDPFFRGFYGKYKRLFKFPESYPPVRWFYIDRKDRRVYLSTYRAEGNERTYLLFDMKGRFLRKAILPGDAECYELLTAIFNKKLYRLLEEDEEWRLDIAQFKE